MRQLLVMACSAFIMSSCVTQSPAPINFGGGSTSRSGYSERTVHGADNDSGGAIVHRDLQAKDPAEPKTGTLQEPGAQKEEHKAIEQEVRAEAQTETTSASDVKPHEQQMDGGDIEAELEAMEDKDSDKPVGAVANTKDAKSAPAAIDKIPPPSVISDGVNNVAAGDIVKPNAINSSASAPLANLSMPVSGKIVKKFGEKNAAGKSSQGIDIVAPAGTDVQSVEEGVVIFAGNDEKFGNLVIVKLKNSDMFAAYAHMEDMVVSTHDEVIKGQVIGHVGATGGVDTPQLHFALRQNKTPVDPMKYLKQ